MLVSRDVLSDCEYIFQLSRVVIHSLKMHRNQFAKQTLHSEIYFDLSSAKIHLLHF